MSDPVPVRICRLDQLIEGRGRPVRVDGRYLAVFLVDGKVHVLDNQCLHVGSPIDGGPVQDGVVFCPWHGWAYRLEDGAQLTAFGERAGLRSYPCQVTEDGEVQVQLGSGVGD